MDFTGGTGASFNRRTMCLLSQLRYCFSNNDNIGVVAAEPPPNLPDNETVNTSNDTAPAAATTRSGRTVRPPASYGHDWNFKTNKQLICWTDCKQVKKFRDWKTTSRLFWTLQEHWDFLTVLWITWKGRLQKANQTVLAPRVTIKVTRVFTD